MKYLIFLVLLVAGCSKLTLEQEVTPLREQYVRSGRIVVISPEGRFTFRDDTSQIVPKYYVKTWIEEKRWFKADLLVWVEQSDPVTFDSIKALKLIECDKGNLYIQQLKEIDELNCK